MRRRSRSAPVDRLLGWLRTGQLPRALGFGLIFVGIMVDWLYNEKRVDRDPPEVRS